MTHSILSCVRRALAVAIVLAGVTATSPVWAVPLLVGPICPMQGSVRILNPTPNATLVLFKNKDPAGNGRARPGDASLTIVATSRLAVGDRVSVVEYVGSIAGARSNIVIVNCFPQNVVTQHNDNARSGAQLAETTLTPANVNETQFGLLYDRHVLGTLLAQPLYVHGVTTVRGLKNLIFVATADDVVYAFDANDMSPDTTINVPAPDGTGGLTTQPESTKWVWRTSLGSPHAGDICAETVPPLVGITSTPVIDVSAGVIYVVAREQRGDTGKGHDYLHALDIGTGASLRERRISATDSRTGLVFNDDCQRQRPGLLLQNGVVYLGYGTYTCDAPCHGGEPYRGWVLGFRAADFAPAGVFTNSSRASEGGLGVWASGNGLAGTSDGSIFYETGNEVPGDAPLTALGDSFVKLHGDGTTLSLASHYQPPFANAYKLGDTDLGAGGPMLLPNGKLIGGGKDGRFFVLSQSNLTLGATSFQAFYNTFHYGPAAYPYNAPPVYSTPCPPVSVFGVANVGQPCYIDVAQYRNGESFGPNIHGGPAMWRNSKIHAFIYKMSEKDYLKSFDYDIGAGVVSPTPAAVATVRPAHDGMPGGFSSLSANGVAHGIVWTVVQQTNDMFGFPHPALLYAHDGLTLGELWNNDAHRVTLAKFNSPTIADGKVILPSVGLFQVYGLFGPSRYQIPPLPMEKAIHVRWLDTGGPLGLLGRPKGPVERDPAGGLRQDFVTQIGGGGYGQISVPPSVHIDVPMCDSRTIAKPTLPVESSLLASHETGAHFVMGEIRRLFLQKGATKQFGYPITDEIPTPDGFGLMTRFERGTIFWYPGRTAEIGEPKTPPLNVIPGKSERQPNRVVPNTEQPASPPAGKDEYGIGPTGNEEQAPPPLAPEQPSDFPGKGDNGPTSPPSLTHQDQAPPGGASMEYDTDRPGGDLGPPTAVKADPQNCSILCQADERCVAWTYVRPGVQGSDAMCWLKNQLTPPTKNSCCVSAIEPR